MKTDINASIEAGQEKRIAELKAAILASFRGSTTCQTETTSSSEEMDTLTTPVLLVTIATKSREARFSIGPSERYIEEATQSTSQS
jgi:hypothetical protein